MRARILCAFDSPAAARLAVPRAVELGTWLDADVTFLALLATGGGGEPCGPAAPQRIRRRAYLAAALVHAVEAATSQLGRRPRAGLVDADDLESETLAQAFAQGAREIVFAETKGLRRRARLRRMSARSPRVAALGRW